MDSKSWLMYQLESMKKATWKEVLENILSLDFSKSRSLVLTKVFYIIFLYYCIFSSGVCCKQTDLSGPYGSPELRAEGTVPLLSGLRSPHNYAATWFPSRHLEWSTPWPSSLLPGKALVSFVLQHRQESTRGLFLCAFSCYSSRGRRTPCNSYWQY